MFHKDEEHRGEHLIDPSNGNLWPWTRTLAAKGWASADSKEEFLKAHAKPKLNVMKLHPVEEPEPEIVVAEDATDEEAIEVYKKEHVKETKHKKEK